MYSPKVLLTSAVLLIFLTSDDDGYRYCVFTWSLRTLGTDPDLRTQGIGTLAQLSGLEPAQSR